MNKSTTAYLIPFFIFVVSFVYAQDPTNKAECIEQLKTGVEKQCTLLFGDSNKEQEELCLKNAPMEVEKQCDRFFGNDNFCSVCTSECLQQFKEDDPTRIECLQTCLNNPACKNKK